MIIPKITPKFKIWNNATLPGYDDEKTLIARRAYTMVNPGISEAKRNLLGYDEQKTQNSSESLHYGEPRHK